MMRHHRTQSSICEAHYDDIPIICIAPNAIAEENSSSMFYVALLSKQNEDVHINMMPDLVRDTAGYFAPDPDFGLDLFEFGDLVNITNGIVCFAWLDNLGLWNPATREFKAIPPWREPCLVLIKGYYFDFFGFGFDSISNDFKIVRVIRYQDHVFGGYEVYSLTTSSWKRLEDVPPSIYSLRTRSSVSAYLNGVCYWFFDQADVMVIVSFNFSTEVFKVFNLPHNVVGSKTGYKYKRVLTLYKDRLALVVPRFDMVKAMRSFDVWVVTEFDDDDSKIPVSWQHLLTIGPFSSSDGLRFSAFRMDGDVVLITEPDDDDLDEYSSLYNPSTGTFKPLDICFYDYYRYVESLFPLYSGKAT